MCNGAELDEEQYNEVYGFTWDEPTDTDNKVDCHLQEIAEAKRLAGNYNLVKGQIDTILDILIDDKPTESR